MKIIKNGLIIAALGHIGLSSCKSDGKNSENMPTINELYREWEMPYERAKLINVKVDGELNDFTVIFHDRGFHIDLGDNNELRYNDYDFNDGSNYKSYHLSWDHVDYIDYGADKDVESMSVKGMNYEFDVNSEEVNSTYRSLLDKLQVDLVHRVWERRWRY